MSDRIPVHAPVLGQPELDALRRCIEEGHAGGNSPIVREFEDAFAGWLGARHALATTSGTTALHLAFATLGIGPGDEVIVPTMTFAPCADMVALCGAHPVFADCDPDTFNLDPESVRAHVTPRTRAVLAVHLYGQAADLDEIGALCAEHGLRLVEDCAQAVGAEWRNQRIGTSGDLACFSFYPNKHLTTGEGGMVTCADDHLAETARHLRDHAIVRGDRRAYHHTQVAFNYRMPAFSAAVGLAQIGRLDEALTRRQAIAEHYARRLAGAPRVHLPAVRPEATRHAYWAHVVLLDRPAAPVAAHLREAGIDTRPFYYPLHWHEAYDAADQSLPHAEGLWERGLVLPSSPTLAEAQIDRVCDTLLAVI